MPAVFTTLHRACISLLPAPGTRWGLWGVGLEVGLGREAGHGRSATPLPWAGWGLCSQPLEDIRLSTGC